MSDQNNTTTPSGITVLRKKLQGYVGFANLPNQVHRKSVKKGFQFTCMVVGNVYIHTKGPTKKGEHRRER
jgi:septin 7